MNSTDPHIIDEYLLHRLEGEELATFERQLLQDKDLAEEVAERKQLMDAVDFAGDILMKERVKKIHQAVVGQSVAPEKPTTNSRGKWIVVAIVLLFGAIALWLVLRPKAETPAQLFASYYEPYDLSFGSRSTDEAQKLAEAGDFYKTGRFAEAQPLFEEVIESKPNESKARLALGICSMELGQYDKALAAFNHLIQTGDPLFKEQATWYAAMANLQLGQVAACKELLGPLADDTESVYQEKASRLLSELE